MKTIGNSNDGGILVEMTREEHHALQRLQLAVEGKSDLALLPMREGLMADMSTALGAVLTFASTVCTVDRLQKRLQEAREELDGRGPSEPEHKCKTCGGDALYRETRYADQYGKVKSEEWFCNNHRTQ